MVLYIILILLLLLCSRLRYRKTISFIVFLSLLLLSALRSYYVGTDTANYLFNNIEQGNLARYLSEPLSYVLMLYSPNHEFFIFAQSVIVLLPLFIIHTKFEKPYLIIFLYYILGFYFFSFNVSRQMIAAAFVLLSLVYYLRKNWILYIFNVIIAFGFHNSSIVALILPLCDHFLKLNRTVVYIVLLSTFIIGLVVSVQVLSIFSPIIGSYIEYIMGEHAEVSRFSLNRLLLNIFFVIIYNCSSIEGKKSLYLKSMFVSVILYNLLTFSGVVGRIAMYFSLSEIVFLSQDKYVKPSRRNVFNAAVLFYGFAYFSLVLINNLGGVVPYDINPIYNSSKVCNLVFMSIGAIIVFYIINYVMTAFEEKSKRIN